MKSFVFQPTITSLNWKHVVPSNPVARGMLIVVDSLKQYKKTLENIVKYLWERYDLY